MQFHKHSSTSMQVSRPGFESRLFSKRGVVYGCTALIILLLFSFIITDRTSQWTSKPFDEPLPLVSTPPIMNDIIPAIIPSPHPPPNGESAQLSPHSHHTSSARPVPEQQREGLTKDGLPLISTRNKGRVVLLTGATG